MTDDPYQVLGIERDATADEIKARYRFLCHAFHPDKFGSAQHLQDASEHLAKIKEAFELLSDSSRRYAFDSTRAANKPPPKKKSKRRSFSRPTSANATAKGYTTSKHV